MEQKTYISDLLKQHDCVIIPGFGGFVANASASYIHPLYHTFHPPYKKILFNVNLKQNDGLLADHIARVEHLSFTDANAVISSFVDRTSQALRNNQPVMIRNLGRLYAGSEETVQFEQDLRVNLLPESYGLQPFFAIPIPRMELQPDPTIQDIPAPRIRELARRSLATPLRWAAALIIPVGIAVLLTFSGYDQLKSRNISYSDVLSFVTSRMNPFSTAESKTVTIPGPVVKEVIKPLPEPAEEKAPPVVQEQVQIQEQPVVQEPGNIAIIVGAFRIEDNAVKLVEALRASGFDALVYDTTRTGLHRVAAGTFGSREEAHAALERLKSGGFPTAWLLIK